MNEDVCYAPAARLAEAIRGKELSPVEVVQAHLDRIDALNPAINAVVTPADDALERARHAETALMRGGPLGPLHGVPYTLKDCVEVAGLRTTLGSRLLEGNVSRTDATVHARLRAAGGILLAKTNMPEFALWWETDNLVFGRTNNPWDTGRTPGGSSGGEAAAIACGMSPLGVGTDLGGSIREPAAFCGIVGLKPTLGRVPYTGILPQVLLRAIHVGPMARTVQDIALGLSVMAGPDGVDVHAPPVPVPDFGSTGTPLPRLRVGWSATGGVPVDREMQGAVAAAASVMADLGLEVEEVEIQALADHDAAAISAVVYPAEAGRHLRPIIAGREPELSDILRERYGTVPPTPLGDYLQTTAEWEALRREVAVFFTRYDLFLCPTVPMPAFPHGQRQFNMAGRNLPARHCLRATLPWDLTGSPAISLPFGWSRQGLPLAVQLVGRHFDEQRLLRAARALEGVRPQRRRPPVA